MEKHGNTLCGYALIDLSQYVSNCFFVKRAVFGNEAAWRINVVLDAPPCYPRSVYGVIVMPFCITFLSNGTWSVWFDRAEAA